MTIIQHKNVVGIGAVLIAATVLTGMGVVFNVLVQNESLVVLAAAIIPLGVAVLAVLAGFNWMLDRFGGDSELDKVQSVASTRHAAQAIRAIHISDLAPNTKNRQLQL
jgi:hypothetical protein